MFPTLIDFGFFHLHTYGACMAVGFLLCWTLIEKLSGRKDLGNLLLVMMISGVVGARAAYVIEHWSAEFAAHPEGIVRVDQGGLMFYGGLLLAIAVFVLWCRVKKESFWEMACLFCTVIPLGHACGRLGCFFYGCCYGRISDSCLAVSFPFHSPAWHEQVRAGLIDSAALRSLPVLPTQLFEAAALLVLFLLLLVLFLRKRTVVLPVYLMGYAVIRFSLEFFRGDPRAAFLGLSIGQLISAGLFLLGLVFWVYGEHTRHHR